MTSLRHQIASLLVGYDVERHRREHDEAIDLLSKVVTRGHGWSAWTPSFSVTAGYDVISFLDRLPLGAVKRARERLAER